MKKYSVVIPIFNEEKNIDELYVRIKAVMESLGGSFEIIFVDDGSEDGSCDKLKRFSETDSNISAVKLSRNFGQENALIAGILCSRGENIILMDGDLQDPPEFIPMLIEEKKKGFEIVYAIKMERKEGFLRKTLTGAFYKIMYIISRAQMPQHAGIFSILSRRAGQMIVNLPEHNKYFSGLRNFIGFKQSGIYCGRETRARGRAKSLYSLTRMGLNAIFSFSMFPLRLVTLIALFGAMLGFAGLIGISTNFTEQLSSLDYYYILLLYGVFFQFFILVLILIVMGEYIGRIHEQIKRRPNFIVESIIQNGSMINPVSINSAMGKSLDLVQSGEIH